jgi:hypothetical protein
MQLPRSKQLRAMRVIWIAQFVACGGTVFSLQGQETHEPAAAVHPANGQAAARKVLRETFRYDPSIRQKALEDETSAGVVKLAPVVVTQSRSNSVFNRYVERQRELAEADKPSVADGAKMSSSRADIGLVPYRDLIPFGPLLPRWTIINIRW